MRGASRARESCLARKRRRPIGSSSPIGRESVETFWDYAITPGMEVGDSAVALYWNPKTLQPAESVTYVTYYGLAGVGGGKAWIDASQAVTSTQPEFQATLWVANNSDADFTGGEATLSLPAGLALAAGESAAKPLPRVPPNGGAQSVSWRLVASGDRDAEYPYSVNVAFESGSRPLSAEAVVRYQAHPFAHADAFADTNQDAVTHQHPSPTPSPTPTPLPFSLLPLVPDTRWNWWPWLLAVVAPGVAVVAPVAATKATRPTSAAGSAPAAAPANCAGEPRNTRPRPSGQDITPDDGRSGRRLGVRAASHPQPHPNQRTTSEKRNKRKI